MITHTDSTRQRNLVLIALMLCATMFSAFDEEYLPLISPLFWGVIVLGFGVAVWLARVASTPRLMSLILSIFLIEHVKEGLGIRAGLWTYHGTTGRYVFGVWVWVLVGLGAYFLATRLVYPQLCKLPISPPRWLHPLLLGLIALSLPLLLGKYWGVVRPSFWALYGALLLGGAVASARMPFAAFASFVITAWVLAAPSEAVGSIASGVWSYPHEHGGPPLFLVVACWPLEILAQAALSCLLSGEPPSAAAGEAPPPASQPLPARVGGMP